MNRDKPPFGPSDDNKRLSGGRDTWNDRMTGAKTPFEPSERESADRYRLARGEQRTPPMPDEFGADDINAPQRGADRMSRFTRDASVPRPQGGEEGFPQPNTRSQEPTRSPFPDRDNGFAKPPPLKRPAFLDRSAKDAARSEQRRPSFLDEPEVDTSSMDRDGERPQPVRRSFRATPQERHAEASGSGRPASVSTSKDTAGLTDWSMVSNERSKPIGNDGEGENYELRQQVEPDPVPAKKDWRSSRFASRFAQPPKAYDLDEVADQELSLDRDPDVDPAYNSDQEGAVRYSEADLVEKARERSRSRFATSHGAPSVSERSLEPLIYDEYDQYDEPEAILPSQIADSRSQDAAYDAEPDSRRGGYMPDRGDTGFDPRLSNDYGYRSAPEDDYQDYLPQDDPENAADEYSLRAPVGQPYGAPVEQPYDDGMVDPYAPEDDQGRHAYDDYGDYDARGRPIARNAFQQRDPYGDPQGLNDDFDNPDCDYQEIVKENNRKPVVLVGALVGVAVLAGGTVFAYQAFVPEGNKEVPVVKLEEAPSKVAPNEPGGLDIPHQNKLFYDRIIGEKTAVAEKVVPREEQVIELENDSNAGNEVVIAPPAPDDVVPDRIASADSGREEAAAILQSSDAPANEVVASAEAAVEIEAAAVSPPELPLPDAPEARVASRAETVEPPAALPPVPKNRPNTPRRVASASVDGGVTRTKKLLTERIPQGDDAAPSADQDLASVPASSVPDAPVSEPDTAQSVAQVAGNQQYMIQIAAFRSEPEAQAEFRRLQGKHTSLLDSFGPVIQKADLGTRGVYYRLRVGPVGNRQDASSLCNSLIAAGEKDCLVRVRPQ